MALTNPILDELAGLSPGAQAALAAAHGAATPPAAATPGAVTAPAPMTAPQAPHPLLAPKASPEIAAYRAKAPEPAPATMSVPPMSGPAPTMPEPAMPNVTPPRGTVQGDENYRGKLLADGSGISQIAGKVENTGFGQNHPLLGKILGGAAQGVATLGDALLAPAIPSVLNKIPGTEEHHNVLVKKATGDLAQDEANSLKEAQTGEEKALTAYTAARPDIEQSKIDQRQTGIQQRIQQQAAARGQSVSFDQDGVPTFTDNPELQAYHMAAATALLHQANAEKAQITGEIAKNHYVPGTPEYDEAQRKLAQVDRKIELAQQNAGLRGAEFSFNQDKFYNPQPTATERKTGDLAQSAVNQIHTMRQIVLHHPEIFGPAAGRSTSMQAWLGSQDPDAQTYLSASRYLADHSAGVFGSRSVEIAKSLEQLTDPHSNPEALMAAFDQAESTAQHFVNAGKVHGKGGGSPSSESAGTGQLTNLMVNDKGEQIGFDGKQWVDAKTKKAVQ